MSISDSENQKTCDSYRDEGIFSHLVESDDLEEEALWRKFEAQDEGDWADYVEDDAYSFAEDGESGDVELPPQAAQLMDHFPSLFLQQREAILDQIKLLVERELGRR